MIRPAVAFAPAPLISPTATRAPSLASRSAVAAPIPVAPPAMMNALPSRPRIVTPYLTASAVRDADIDRNLGSSNEFGLPGRQPGDRIGDVLGLGDPLGQQWCVHSLQPWVRLGGGL